MAGVGGGRGATGELAEWVAGTGFEALPAEVVVRAKSAMLDTLGVILAGTSEPVTRMVAEQLAEDGCAPLAAQLGTSFRTSPEGAALLNGVSGHALDFDDVSASVEGHPSVVILPAALAAAELAGASGRELVAAYAIGVEVMAKLGRAAGRRHYQAGWHATSTLGTVGAAAAAGRLLGLDASRLQMALAISVSEAAGSRQNFGTMTKPFHAGHAARCGVQAARLAGRGMTASADALEGELGFFALFAQGAGRPDRLAPLLGRPWDLASTGLSVKKYACCFAIHRAADALLALRADWRLRPEDVSSLTVLVPPGGLAPLIHDRALTGLEGKFCMRYVMAAGMLDGRIGLDTFSDEMVRRPEALALGELVQVREDPAIAVRHSPFDEGHVEVRVELADGNRLTRRIERPLGSPDLPMPRQQLEAKFRDCAAASLPGPGVERALAALNRLEELQDVAELVSLLTPAAARAHP